MFWADKTQQISWNNFRFRRFRIGCLIWWTKKWNQFRIGMEKEMFIVNDETPHLAKTAYKRLKMTNITKENFNLFFKEAIEFLNEGDSRIGSSKQLKTARPIVQFENWLFGKKSTKDAFFLVRVSHFPSSFFFSFFFLSPKTTYVFHKSMEMHAGCSVKSFIF